MSLRLPETLLDRLTIEAHK
ncbi:hypothetical protein [Vreelandella neptunia]